MNLGRAITLVKQLTNIVVLMFLPKTLIWNKTALLASNSLNFPELVVNELKANLGRLLRGSF